MKSEISTIKSPCVRNCCLDDDDICLGCFRSMPEIISWADSNTTAQQKRQILHNIEIRKAKRQTRHF